MVSSITLRASPLFLTALIGVALVAPPLFPQPRNAWVRYYSNRNFSLQFFDVYRDDQGLAMTGMAMVNAQPPVTGFALWRTRLDGNLLWTRVYTRDNTQSGASYCIVGTDDGGFLLGGTHQHQAALAPNYTVIKVDEEGEVQWWREFYDHRGYLLGCAALLELKSNHYFTAGAIYIPDRGRVAYCNLLDRDGELIWEIFYPPAFTFSAAREAQDGILVVGAGDFSTGYLLLIGEEGRILSESRFDSSSFWAMASCPVGGGHAILGTTGAGLVIIRLNREHRVVWRRLFAFDNPLGSPGLMDIRQLPDGGLIACFTIRTDTNTPTLLRLDAPGNEMWRRYDRHRTRDGQNDRYCSLAIAPDGFPYVVGWAWRGPYNGVLLKVLPDRSEPLIVAFHPPDQEITVLRGDSLLFWVRAIDWQDDSLSYRWYRGEELVGTDTAATIDFPELGDVLVKVIVSDTTGSDSARWMVHVKNLFISAHQPDSLNLIVRRNARVNFGLEVAYNGDPQNLNYRWWLRDMEDPHRREEVGGNSPQIALNFPMTGQFGLEGYVSDGEAADSVRWEVRVRGLIRAVYPEREEVFIAPHQEVRLGVIPFDPGDPTLRYWWGIDADTLASESQITEQVIAFPEVGQYSVWCFVRSISDSLGEVVESDSQFWRVTVSEPEGIDGGEGFDGGQLLPQALTLTVHPNPFNASAQVRVYLPEASKVRLGLYDLAGREVALLSDGTRLFTPGLHTFTLSADGSLSLPAGLYLLTLETPSSRLLQKVVVMR